MHHVAPLLYTHVHAKVSANETRACPSCAACDYMQQQSRFSTLYCRRAKALKRIYL